jgi:hypothetical protein
MVTRTRFNVTSCVQCLSRTPAHHTAAGHYSRYSGRAEVWMTRGPQAAGGGDFSAPQIVQTGRGPQAAAYLMGTAVLSRGAMLPGQDDGQSLRLAPTFRMSAAITLLPLHALISWKGTLLLFRYIT